VSHASEVLTRIVGGRIKGKIEENLTENHFGFRKNRGTREAILCLRLHAQKVIHVRKPMCIALVDLEKAFDNVEWNKMSSSMEKLGMNCNDRWIICRLYKDQVATIRMQEGRNIDAKNKKKGSKKDVT
jgi:hypothetical protein